MAPTEKPTSAPRAPRFPERVGMYEILLPIASGGMATVYLARSRSEAGVERDVALKLTHAHLRKNEEFARHLLEEAKLASGIRHPNVVPVLDVGDDPLGIFLVMEYVEGDTLSNLGRLGSRRGGRLPVPIGIRILVDALRGLHAAHELRDPSGRLALLVHRDFSPQNILVRADGITQLTDFGVAKAATRLGQTATGIVKGKVAYMAPEHARGRPLDRRADVFSAGVIAWEIVAGRRLHGNDNDLSAIVRVAREAPPRLSAVVPGVPPDIERTVAGALAMDRDGRCPSAAELAHRLEASCQAHGLLATTDEVGAFVVQAVGSKLAERRERVREVFALRSRLDDLATSEAATVATPSFEHPGPDDPEPTSETSHPEQAFEPATGAVTAIAAVPTPPSGSIVARAPASSVSGHEDQGFRPMALSAPSPEETIGTDSVAVSQRRPTAARSRVGIAMAVGATVALLVIVPAALVSLRGSGNSDPIASVPAAPASTPPAATTATPSAAPAAKPATSEPATRAVSFTLRANTEVHSVRIGAREVSVDPPQRDIAVTLTEEEAAAVATLVVTSGDGRAATVGIDPGASHVDVRFAPKPRKVVPAAIASPTTKPTAPLATNPYAR